MRYKLIARLEELRDSDGLDNDFLSFEVGDTDLSTFSDEQLIEILETYGMFEG